MVPDALEDACQSASDGASDHSRTHWADLGPEVASENMRTAISENMRADRIYANWVPSIKRRLQLIYDRRGKLRRRDRLGSVCTGLGPEERAYHLCGLPLHLVFCNDFKIPTINFYDDNHVEKADHWYMSLKSIMEGNRSFCYTHNGMCNMATDGLDVLVGGITCKAFAICRTGRQQDWASHKDAWLLLAWLRLLKAQSPETAFLENVLGFLKVDSTGRSPLSVLLEYMRDMELDRQYHIRIFVAQGDVFTVWPRRRIYIVFVTKAFPITYLQNMDMVWKDARCSLLIQLLQQLRDLDQGRT